MRPLSGGEVSGMRATQEGVMHDTCRILAHASTQDDYGNPDSEYVAGSAQECGVEHRGPDDWHGSGDVPAIDGRIRLPIDTEIGPDDRIRVTHRHGEELDAPQVFDVVGVPRRGATGMVADVILVTTI